MALVVLYGKIDSSAAEVCRQFHTFILFKKLIRLKLNEENKCLPSSQKIFQHYFHNSNPKTHHQPICSQYTRSLTLKNIRKPYGFLMFSGGGERVPWEQMG